MREIRGWNVGEVVTANYMGLNTANLLEQTGQIGEANLPCIYNGLTLASQTGTEGENVTFNSGIARCRDLPLSVFTYLPPNAYGESYPCFIDISTLDANETIVLSTGITSGYIVATFSISPVTPNAVNYTITGSLLQIATGAYNPANHVRLCSFTYALSTFTLDFTPGTSRDTDMTGIGGVQWDYGDSNLIINTPASQTTIFGTTIILKQTTQVDGYLKVNDIVGVSPATPGFPDGLRVTDVTNLAENGPVNFPFGITTDSFLPPTQQIFNSGSGTYVPTPGPRLPLYCKVQIWSGGGGGSGSGNTSPGGNGGNGTASVYNATSTPGGTGGTSSGPGIGGVGFTFTGKDGALGTFHEFSGVLGNVMSYTFPGGVGGVSPYSSGSNGCGGDGGKISEALSGVSTGISFAGNGGGGSGYTELIVPPTSVPYSIGGGGSGGTAGPGGFAGLPGVSGKIIITEHYQ